MALERYAHRRGAQIAGLLASKKCLPMVIMIKLFDRTKMFVKETSSHPIHSVHVMDPGKLLRCRLRESMVSSVLVRDDSAIIASQPVPMCLCNAWLTLAHQNQQDQHISYEHLMLKRCSDLERLRKLVSQSMPDSAEFSFTEGCSCCQGLCLLLK